MACSPIGFKTRLIAHWILFSLTLLLGCRGRGLDTKGSVQYCQSREGESGQATERCFGLRVKIALPVGGLFNQHLALLSFVTLGIASGCVEMYIEHSPRRKHSMAVAGWDWEQEPFDSLWDTDHLRQFLEGQDISLLTGRHKADSSVLPLAAFQSLHEQRKDISDAVSGLRKHVLTHTKLLTLPGLFDKPGQQIPATVEVPINSQGTFRGLRTSQSEIYRDVARHTLMAPRLQSLAQSCIAKMGTGNRSYVGIHLRIEDDFDRAGRTGGRVSMLKHYREALQQQGIARNEQLYIASGIFTTEPDFAVKYLREWSSKITHRAAVLSAQELGTLDVEQLAAIDFLVVSKAARFIGWQGSSFSFWVPEERALLGLEASTSFLIRGGEESESEQDAFAITHGVTRREPTAQLRS